MSGISNDIKTRLLEHSQAKVELFGEYLSIYLNILSRVRNIENIFIFDLFCGEGLYENGLKGSPLIAIDKINEHFMLNFSSKLNIFLTFNDNGYSAIEPGTKKIERLRTIIDHTSHSQRITIDYSFDEFENILTRSIQRVSSTDKAKALFFIDPYGYKNIHPKSIKTILALKSTEVILFLPVSHMYRFANKCLSSQFRGSEPLHDFLSELFFESTPSFNSICDFIKKVKEQFRFYLRHDKIFVDSFSIERDRSNTYCLFFFTSNVLGFEKMLATKWKIDSQEGRGFRLASPQIPLFGGVEFSDYPQKLRDYIATEKEVTNKQIYIFGLINGYLPKHSNEVLKDLKANDLLEIIPLDGKPAKGFYLSYRNYCDPPERQIAFRVKNNERFKN